MCLFLSFFTLFRLFLDGFVRAVALLLEANMDAREACIAVHQAKVIVRLIVTATYGYKMIGTRSNASASGFAIGTYFALSSSPAYHHTAFIYIYSSCQAHKHIFTNSQLYENFLLKDWMVWLCVPSPKLSSSAFSYLNQRRRIIYPQVKKNNKPFSFPYKKKKKKQKKRNSSKEGLTWHPGREEDYTRHFGRLDQEFRNRNS